MMIEVEDVCGVKGEAEADCIVSSWLAHMFPFSPLSIGMSPSKGRLEDGSKQDSAPKKSTLLSQPAKADDPFTDCTVPVKTVYCEGIC